jgi:hypothetical protein
MSGTKLLSYKQCECCKENFPLSDVKSWEWKMSTPKGTEYFCSYKCYSKVFDSRFKASRVSSRVSVPSAMPVELERAIRGGRR